jgi:hypothetical protein
MARAERKSSRVADTAPAAAEEFPTWLRLEPQLDEAPDCLRASGAARGLKPCGGQRVKFLMPPEYHIALGIALVLIGAALACAGLILVAANAE